MSAQLAVIVLAAGKGTRTKVSTPKVLLPLCGRSLLLAVLDAVDELQPDRTLVVVAYDKARVAAAVEQRPGVEIVDQGEPQGTGHAVQVAMAQLQGFTGDVMVVYGDVPLLTGETLRALREARAGGPASMLTATVPDPHGLGRVLRNESGDLIGIREQRDCTPEESEIDEINAGIYCFDPRALAAPLAALTADNAQGEYYLTDVIGHLAAEGLPVATVELEDCDEILGVNSLVDLAVVRDLMQERILVEHLQAGVLIEDPGTTYIDHGVEIGVGTRILPCTVIRAGARIGRDCEVGPFAHLRTGAVLEDGAAIGNFVEAKNARLGRGSKAKHLTYLGDTTIGESANIGAGTITANYDGRQKHHTHIGDGAFVGSGTVLVAPSRMGKGARTGAGAIVTRGTEIGAGETFVGIPARPLRTRPDGAGDSGRGAGDAR